MPLADDSLASGRVTIASLLRLRHDGWRPIRFWRQHVGQSQTLPRSLALGAAIGIFVAVLPIPGLQLASAAGLAWLTRAHRGVALAATFAANPLTYPLIWLASYLMGALILGVPVTEAAHEFDRLSAFMNQGWSPSLWTAAALSPMLTPLAMVSVGAVPLAFSSAALAYAGVRQFLR